MTIAYFDCFSGVSGDMTLGAMVDLGVPLDWLKAQLAGLPLSGFELEARTVMRSGIQGTRVVVTVEERPPHRHFSHIRDLIDQSDLAGPVKADSLSVFETLARAEARIHGCDPEQVHFHEVGAMDAIVDIVGACLAKDYLGIEAIVASPLPLGRGFVTCAHGTLPVPAPAVLEILKGVPVYSGSQDKELVTPTGAALLAALAERFDAMPLMQTQRIGYGAGTHELKNQPNLLRVILGTLESSRCGETAGTGSETLVMVETNIDDMNPEIFGFLMEQLFSDGALDVYWVPVQMKKSRPGTLVQVLCRPESQGAVTARILAETTTLGVRYHQVQRVALEREAVQVETPLGKVAAKKVSDGQGGARVVPEFESCKQIALARGLPIARVYEAVAVAVAKTPQDRILLDKQQLDKTREGL